MTHLDRGPSIPCHLPYLHSQVTRPRLQLPWASAESFAESFAVRTWRKGQRGRRSLAQERLRCRSSGPTLARAPKDQGAVTKARERAVKPKRCAVDLGRFFFPGSGDVQFVDLGLAPQSQVLLLRVFFAGVVVLSCVIDV